MKRFTFFCLVATFIFQSCSTNSEIAKTEEVPPSIIYADDSNTILSFYSNVGKNVPRSMKNWKK